jgi:predicted dehydrogenase
MSQTTLRWGLLSTANINGEMIGAAAETDRAEIVAVASRDGERAQAYAEERGIPTAHRSYEALLEDDSVDAVYVSLPNGLHHEWTMHALAAGKHVLCEKPYSRRPADVEEAFDTADAAGLVLMEAFMYRHHPQTREIERIVRDGEIGRVVFIAAAFTFPLTDLTNVRALPSLEGGALMDVGCYCVSGSRLVAGEPVSVLAEQVTGPTGIDMGMYATMRFDGDVVAQFDASFLAPRRQYLEVVGEEGALLAHAPWRVDWPGDLQIIRDDVVEVLEVPEVNSYRLQLENMADAVSGEAPALLGRADALGQARAIDALYRSATEGRAVVMG